MSWLFSQVLVEEYLVDTFSDGEQSAPLNGSHIQQAYCAPDKMTGFSRLSRFGMTYKPLTESRGEELLKSYRAVFLAKTSQQPEKAQGLMESDQECGVTWQESSEKWSQLSLLSKTPQCSEQEDLALSSMTLTRWGSMQSGVVSPLQPLEPITKETGFGLWASPNARDWKDSGASQGKRKSPNLGTQVHWPTPRTKGMCGGSGSWDLLNKNTTVEEARLMGAGNGGKLNPTWVEWIMGWPLGWTDLKPLAMDKSHFVQPPPGSCSQHEQQAK
jgi:hypothetical protein